MTEIRVLAPGFLSTCQDLGRYGYAHLGISASGAADALSLRWGNLLVGNPQGAAGLEMTLIGGILEFSSEATIALTGSEFAANVPWCEAIDMKAGDTLRIGPTRAGARCYLCVRGGISVPLVLGSSSTHVLTAIGGCGGRGLKKGDVLQVGDLAVRPARRGRMPLAVRRTVMRITDGPQRSWFANGMDRATYRVAENSNRMGLRLEGPELECSRELLTEGVSLGAIQVPRGGQPILTFVEHQTTGGYPKIATIISADLSAVGQLRPRDEIRFETVSLVRAIELLREQEARMCSLT
jgi:biotin-dependent carboxylase-like uncharacterized protein